MECQQGFHHCSTGIILQVGNYGSSEFRCLGSMDDPIARLLTNPLPTLAHNKTLLPPLKTNITLENPHVQWEIHLQMVDFPLSC